MEMKFPHEYNAQVQSLNGTIEDDVKLHAELSASEFRNTPQDKWSQYKNLCYWVSFCDRVGIEIENREEVFAIMRRLWEDVRNSEIYKPHTSEFITRKIDELINQNRNVIQSLWDNMEDKSKQVTIGTVNLTEGEDGDIKLKDWESVTEHDKHHVCGICSAKRFIYSLEKLKSQVR